MKIRSFFRKGGNQAESPKPAPAVPEIRLPAGFTSLMIATPAYGAQLHAGYVRSLLRTQRALIGLGIGFEYFVLVNESMIPRGRDHIAAAFTASACSHLIMVDADIEFQAEAVVRLLQQAAVHDMVMGIYRRKRQEVDYPVNWTVESGQQVTMHPATGCCEIVSGPGGFVMVSRSLVERMQAAYPELKYETLREFDEHRYALYNPLQEGHILFGEDISFCRRWRAIGGTIWVDPVVNLVHHGAAAFDGNPMRDLFRRADAVTSGAA